MSKQIITVETPQFGNPDFAWGAYLRNGESGQGCYGKTEAEALANLKRMIGDAEFNEYQPMTIDRVEKAILYRQFVVICEHNLEWEREYYQDGFKFVGQIRREMA